jgi:predicted N-acetyltransferase YhbS
MASTLSICPLADHPEAIPLLARWFQSEWSALDGRSFAAIEAQLAQNLNRDSIPITFVALRHGKVCGTISIDLSDLPSHDHLSPWLASFYVPRTMRQQGIGTALIQHVHEFVTARGLRQVYLWTFGSTDRYERCGWQAFEHATYASRPITLMRLTPNSPRLR